MNVKEQLTAGDAKIKNLMMLTTRSRADLRMTRELVKLRDEDIRKFSTELRLAKDEIGQRDAEIMKLKAELTGCQSVLDKVKDNNIRSLVTSLREATEMRRKIETEYRRVLTETAGRDFKDLRAFHLALLRKTTSCSPVDIKSNYDPVVDNHNKAVTLGSGVFGTVYAFKEKGVAGTTVAIKVLKDVDPNDDDYDIKRQEVILEARLLKLLSGTGVFPRVLGSGTLPVDRTAIVMEFLGDDADYGVTTIREWTSPQSRTRISLCQAKSVIIDVLNGVKALHDNDILHNDIKGDNVIVKKTGVDTYKGYVIDVGNATTTYLPAFYSFERCQREAYSRDPINVHYAPELIFDGARTTTATDVYQLGRLVYLIGEDLHQRPLLDIGKRCLCREPHQRLKLEKLMGLIAQL
ncbi:uncharacterized protein [Diadema setosum]|uniref:uncharacterized protein n=1 Tax=Diadema setosum TaxID=31175 RepID=UPI003B3A3664